MLLVARATTANMFMGMGSGCTTTAIQPCHASKSQEAPVAPPEPARPRYDRLERPQNQANDLETPLYASGTADTAGPWLR